IDAMASKRVSRLSIRQRETLVQLVVQDWRCVDALPLSLDDDAERVGYAQLLRHCWLDEKLYHLVDLRDRFLVAAEALQYDSRPAASLVLYCAWIEQTLSLTCIRCSQRSGLSGKSLDAYAEKVALRAPAQNAATLLRTALAGPIRRDLGRRVERIFRVRRFAIHFRWVGTEQRQLQSRLRRLVKAVEVAQAIVAELQRVEQRVTPMGKV